VPRPLVIAVDCSTTATKAVAFDPAGTVVAEGRSPHGRSSPQPGWQEQDAGAWWDATAHALRAVVASLPPGARPVAVGLTHQRETFVCLDREDAPLRPAILWLDTRASRQIARLGSPAIHARSGKPPSTTPSLYKLAWLADHEPDVLRRTALVLDVHGYLVRRLTGRAATSWASADGLSLLDLASLDWSDELLAAASLRRDQLPELVEPGTVIGTVGASAARQTGLAAGLPVVAGAGDGQCSGLGAGVLACGEAYLNLGTGLALGVHVETYRWDRAYRTLAGALPGRYVLESLLASGALSIDWFRDLVSSVPGAGEDRGLEDAAARVPPGARGLLFLPYLSSAETPYWDPDARGAFVGIGDGHTRGELYRAILEGLAYEKRLSLELIEAATGTRVRRVVVTGGASRSPLLRQILADVLERTVVLPRQPETTALGAAILAGAAVGLHGTSDLGATAARMTGSAQVHAPRLQPRPIYRAAAAVHRQIYPSLLGLSPQLAELRRASDAAGA